MFPLHVLFSSDPLEPLRVDDKFAAERMAFEAAGFSTSLCSDDVLIGAMPPRVLPAGAVVVYRGWMLTADQYACLSRSIVQRGASPLTSPAEYLTTHHLPNW